MFPTSEGFLKAWKLDVMLSSNTKTNAKMKITTHLSSPWMKLTHLQKLSKNHWSFTKANTQNNNHSPSFIVVYSWKTHCGGGVHVKKCVHDTIHGTKVLWARSNISKINLFLGFENLNFTSTHKQPPRWKATKEVEKMTKFKDCAIRAQTCIIVNMTSLKKMCILNFFWQWCYPPYLMNISSWRGHVCISICE
jgi:hypothetical protein